MPPRFLPLAFAMVAGSAEAQDLRDLCTTRPSLGTSACIVDKGHALIEFGAVDYEVDKAAGEETDTLLSGDALLRFGLTDTSEIQVGWVAFDHIKEKDLIANTSRSRDRVGDVTVTFRQNLRNPDGSGLSFGVQPFVSLPVGRQPAGAGTWGGGIVVPVSFELSDNLKLVVDPEADAEPDLDGHGRHLRYGNVTGVELDLTKAIAATFEISAFRDRDPDQHFTELLAALSFTWQPSEDLQFDAGAIAGLNHDSPDVRLLAGVSRRF